jgi:hypothetical protein
VSVESIILPGCGFYCLVYDFMIQAVLSYKFLFVRIRITRILGFTGCGLRLRFFDISFTALPGVMRYISSGQDARTTRVS